MGLMGILTGKLYDMFGIKPLAIIGLTILTVVSFMLTTLSMDTHYLEVMILYTIRSFGLSFVMMPITTAGLATMHGINTAFLVAAVISAIALALSFFFKKQKLEASTTEKEILILE